MSRTLFLALKFEKDELLVLAFKIIARWHTIFLA